MIRIILLTQYYPPETGAPQNRLHELALRLIHNGFEIEVLTAMPNYPSMEIFPSYKGKSYVKESIDGIKVHRTSIYVSKSKRILPRLLNYFSFVFSSLWYGIRKLENADLLICESPPLFLGISALILSRRKKAKLIMNISDLWPESAEKLGLVTNRLLLKSAERLEMFLYRKSWIVTGQTMGIVRNIEERNPGKRVYWLPNGVDLTYYNPDQTFDNWRAQNGFSSSDFIILYAGILGHAQGLEVILNAAEITRNETQIKWVLVGTGPVKPDMLRLKSELDLKEVYFFDPVSKDKMPSIVAAADVAVIPLKKLDLFKGAIPSKIFESLAMRKPLLLGVEGEAEELFIRKGKCGLSFTPEDPASLAASAMELAGDPTKCIQMGIQARMYVSEVFDREKIASGFSTFIHDVWQQEKSKDTRQ